MKILAPVDPSDTLHLAVSKAAAMAKKEGAELTLLAVAETMEDMESLYGATATDRLKARATTALDAAQALAKAQGITAREMLETGVSPEDIIIETAQKGGFDLIVMGTRSKTGLRRLLLGSVASKVATLAPCSVLVAR